MRLWGDLLPGGQLVEHVDQRFLGLVGLLKEPLADHQAAFFYRAVQVEQGFAQRIYGLQVEQKGRLAQVGQLVQQTLEAVALMGVLPPVAQQRFGLEQNVHALAQKLADTLRVPRGRQRARRRIQGHVQPFADP